MTRERVITTHYEGLRASLDTGARGKRTFAPAGNKTPVFQSVVRHKTELSRFIFITVSPSKCSFLYSFETDF
jgi:hypothetical protein